MLLGKKSVPTACGTVLFYDIAHVITDFDFETVKFIKPVIILRNVWPYLSRICESFINKNAFIDGKISKH